MQAFKNRIARIEKLEAREKELEILYDALGRGRFRIRAMNEDVYVEFGEGCGAEVRDYVGECLEDIRCELAPLREKFELLEQLL